MTNKQGTNRTRVNYPADVDVSDWQAKQSRDPEYVAAYEALGPEFEVAEQVIKLRLEQKMTQAELAQRSGTQQPAIARLEKGRGAMQLGFIRRVANSLNASVHISLEPRPAYPELLNPAAKSADPRKGKLAAKKGSAKKSAAKKQATRPASKSARAGSQTRKGGSTARRK